MAATLEIEVRRMGPILRRMDNASRKDRGIIDKWASGNSDLLRDDVRSFTPMKRGTLRASIKKYRLGPGRYAVRTASKYAPFVERGIGLYGPRRRYIVPINARALRFVDPMAAMYSKGRRAKIVGPVVYTKWVKGFKGFRMFAKGQDQFNQRWPQLRRDLQNELMGSLTKD